MFDEREISMEYVASEEMGTYFASILSKVKRMKKLMKKHPDKVKILKENRDNSVLFQIPAIWIKDPGPPKEMSKEKIEAARERMKKYHNERKSNNE